MLNRYFALFALILFVAGGCSEDKVSAPLIGKLQGRVTIDGEGADGVIITVSSYQISGQDGSAKAVAFSAVAETGDYAFDLYPGNYRADFQLAMEGEDELTAARYPIVIAGGDVTVLDVELKDPVPHSFMARDGDAAVELSWESAYGAALYRVYRSVSPTAGFQIAAQTEATHHGTFFYSDQPPTLGTYYYKVTSVSAGDVESESEAVRQVDFTAAIGPPTGLEAIDMIDYVHLAWESKPRAVKYVIQRSGANQQNWSVIDTTTVIAYDDIPADTSIYYYRLTALSAYGTTSPPCAAVPVHYDRRFDPPEGLSIDDRGYCLFLNWLEYDNIAYYSIYRSLSASGQFQHLDTTINSYYADSPLDTGTYFYFVTATGPNDLESEPSAVVSASFDDILEFPAGFTAVNHGLYVQLSWQEVYWAGAYLIFRLDEDVYVEIARVSGTVLSYQDAPLFAGIYNYRIATETITGRRGNLSEPVAAQFTNNLLAPAWVEAQDLGTSLRISWAAVESANGARVYRAQSEGGSFEFVDSTSDLNFRDMPVTPGPYYYKIRATDSLGHVSPFSVSAYIYFSGAPLPPYDVSPLDSLYRVLITWDAIDAGTFLVYRSAQLDGDYSLIGTTESHNFFDWPAQAGHYFYKARIKIENDTSGFSEFGHVYFSGILQPPSDVSAFDAGSHIRIEWQAPPGTSYYEVYQALSLEGSYQLILTVYENLADHAPDSSGTYYFKVKAFTQGDLGSPFSAPVEVYFEP